ncbi:MAG: two pore domain potassium channel family protein [Betaproteobacteria bacterium]|nr:MAG: two pore domain potassium channel family protein [Betaproteobacteria bacterium]
MISFFINLYRLLAATVYGLRRDDEFRALMVLLVLLLVGGALFYWEVEGWSVLDAIYFCVMTMSTVGYGDLAPTSPFSKIFTIVFTILSIGIFAAVVSKVVQLILERKKARSQIRAKSDGTR